MPEVSGRQNIRKCALSHCAPPVQREPKWDKERPRLLRFVAHLCLVLFLCPNSGLTQTCRRVLSPRAVYSYLEYCGLRAAGFR
jgi:hypothetical protein